MEKKKGMERDCCPRCGGIGLLPGDDSRKCGTCNGTGIKAKSQSVVLPRASAERERTWLRVE